MQKSILIILLVLVAIIASAQDHSKALASADTLSFSINKKEGWLLYNSFIAPVKTDSVAIGLIFQHDRDINWDQEQLIGKIRTESLFPKAVQTITYKLMQDIYQIRVDKNGKCYLRLVSGSVPGESGPVILPIRAVYKK